MIVAFQCEIDIHSFIVIKTVLCRKKTAKFDGKMVKLKCLIKEKDDRIALNMGPPISIKEKRRAEEAKPMGPAVSHQRNCRTLHM